jgi:hypothetical protein
MGRTILEDGKKQGKTPLKKGYGEKWGLLLIYLLSAFA